MPQFVLHVSCMRLENTKQLLNCKRPVLFHSGEFDVSCPPLSGSSFDRIQFGFDCTLGVEQAVRFRTQIVRGFQPRTPSTRSEDLEMGRVPRGCRAEACRQKCSSTVPCHTSFRASGAFQAEPTKLECDLPRF